MITVFSPAKVNLTLHVTGQRDDGYHLLDSLVCFPEIGDKLTFQPADQTTLTVHGMGHSVPTDRTNLVLKTADLTMPDQTLQVDLYKDLPVAGGIGGGSANAGATMRTAPIVLDDELVPDQAFLDNLLAIGADVPACAISMPLRMRGIGEKLNPLTSFPGNGTMVLVNPRISTPTPAIFKALHRKDNDPMPEELPDLSKFDDLVSFIAAGRNDLQAPAIAEVPDIGKVLDALEALPDCAFARMSGSGATCFGLFATQDQAVAAIDKLRIDHPSWWCSRGAMQTPFDAILPKGQFKRATT